MAAADSHDDDVACPICGGTRWEAATDQFLLHNIDASDSIDTGRGLTLLVYVCRQCLYVRTHVPADDD